MTIAQDARIIQVPGRVEILAAFPSSYTSLFHVGESEDGIQISMQPFYHDVPGDSYGGQGGPPIEKQFLGMMARFSLRMSKWDKAQITKFQKMGGLLATDGLVPLASVGALMLETRSIRLLLVCTRDAAHTINFPCCIVSEPITMGKQSKYSTCGLSVEAHRTPEAHWAIGSGSLAAGVVWDGDTSGVPGS